MKEKRTEHNGMIMGVALLAGFSEVTENPCVLGSIPRLATTDSAGFGSTAIPRKLTFLPFFYRFSTTLRFRKVTLIDLERLRIDPHGSKGRSSC